MVNAALASDIVKGYITRLTRNYMSHAVFPTLLFLFSAHAAPLISSTFQDVLVKLPWASSLSTNFYSV